MVREPHHEPGLTRPFALSQVERLLKCAPELAATVHKGKPFDPRAFLVILRIVWISASTAPLNQQNKTNQGREQREYRDGSDRGGQAVLIGDDAGQERR